MVNFGSSYPVSADLDPFAPCNDDDKLDAYGHLTWCVAALEDQPDDPGDEWMVCFDAIYNPVTNKIEYEAVVDGGNFVDTIEKGAVLACDESAVQGLKELPAYWHDAGLEQGLAMDEDCLKSTAESWAEHIDDLAFKAISREDMEALTEALGERERIERECRP